MKSQKDITIGIVGYGYVGKAMCEFFQKHYAVIVHDPAYPDKSSPQTSINQCDYVFVCVPTPCNRDGSCDTSIVEQTISWITTPLICIKSTVEIGTTKRLVETYKKRIVFSPEYCGESTYWTPYKFHTDIKETPFFIFGGDKNDCHELINLYNPICGPVKTYRVTDSTSAELTKYIENSFYATKIAFCNEMYDVCKKAGTDWNEVRELWLLDPRLNPMHTLVFPNKRGFRGKCLPKDSKALAQYAKNIGAASKVLEAVIESNDNIVTANAN